MKTWAYSWLMYPFLYGCVRVLAVFNKKVRDTLRLRSWRHFLSLRLNAGQPIEYWLHVASAGELEYAIPVLEELERREKRVLITYYSISAKGPVERLHEKFSNVSLVVPLPHDGLGLMKGFVELVWKQGVRHLLLLKYELWPGLLGECNRLRIAVILIDALRPSWFHKRLLHKLDSILPGYQSESEGYVHRDIAILGDTRVERVLERIEQAEEKRMSVVPVALCERLADKPVLVLGSMWPPDTALMASAFESMGERPRCHVIWVPHELEETQRKDAISCLSHAGFHAIDWDEKLDLSAGPCAIIVMKKGILAELYGMGRAAYVGGAFGRGVHSVWEPALSGAKVACGPRVERSPEAKLLAANDWLTVVRNSEDGAVWLRSVVYNVSNGRPSQADREALLPIVQQHLGAARRIIEHCEGPPKK